ncbi:hypothetical protein VTN02DRAFT_1686 [Thermoascus thermophilus]
MATPPPEGGSILKDKTQLPPQVTDIGLQDSLDVKAAALGKPAEAVVDSATNQAAVDANKEVSPAVNGHSDAQSPLTNGVNSSVVKNEATSPPKSPKSPPLSSPTNQTSSAQPETAPSNNSEVEVKTPGTDNVESKPAATSPPNSTDKTAPADNVAAQNTQQTASEAAPSGDIKMENAPEAQKPAVEGHLPHHPPPASKPENVSGVAQPAPAQPQQADQEMRDASHAPASPTKIHRERDTDPSDEPAAKRTKTNGDASEAPEFKVPELPTPATDGPMEHEMGITKVQHKFLLKGIQSLKRMHDSRFYREPVDPIKMNIPHYPSIITRPMDLGTIEKKLKANQYPSVQALVDDFNLMVNNALVFNGPDHLVTQEGQKLKATFDKQMANLPRPDEVEEKKPKKAGNAKTTTARREPRAATGQGTARNAASPQSTTFALGPEGLPLIRRDSTNADGRPKRSIHPPKRDLPYTTKPKKKYQWELRFCQEVLDELHKQKHYSYAVPFYYPVDPVALNIPTYHSIIKRPMDLSTVQSKLKTGQYENSKDFEVDMRQIFKNCFKFNIPGDPTFTAGKKLEEVFEAKWAQKARWLETHEPHREHQSAGSSDEDSDEEEEDSDDDADQEKLNMLQRQIAEMSKQVEAITQKKKKTPPASGKKSGKSKTGKKESKKGTVGGIPKKDKKGIKGSKPEKQRWVTYHEKQIISNGISSLPDKKMQEALKIIQNNVPSLKGTQETEIELDIDELPNEVLVMLLKFVKKNAPHVLEEEEPPAPIPSAAPAKPKKNKPMSKYEQEAQINMLENNLSRFQGATARSPDPVPSVEANVESSDEDDDSEESEEE